MPQRKRAGDTMEQRISRVVRAFVNGQPGAGLMEKRQNALEALDRAGLAISQPALMLYEKGGRMQLGTFAGLCAALGVSADAILFGRGAPARGEANGASEWLADADAVFWAESQPLVGTVDTLRARAADDARDAFPALLARSLASEDGVAVWAARLVDWFAMTDPAAPVRTPSLPIAAAEACRHLATAVRRATPRSIAHVLREVRTLEAAPALFARAASQASGRRGSRSGEERQAIGSVLLACCLGLDVPRPPHLRRLAVGDEVRARVLWTEIAARIGIAAR